MLVLEGLQIGYGRKVLATLPPVTAVAAGEFVCLLGRNGQGKSTLLRTLGGFLAPVAGQVRLHGRPVTALRGVERARRIAVVLTERPQVGALGVMELVEMGRQPHTGWAGVLSEEDRRIAVAALDQVGGAHLAARMVDSLSDGERQRVMIARALAQQPDMMLLDEITAFLDLPSRVTIIDTLRRIAAEQGVAIVLSSHDLELSLQTADRLWLLPGGGRFVDGAPEDVALSGAVGSAFDQENLAFSLDSGRFESAMAAGRCVHVEGDDVATLWLSRALRRCGYGLEGNPDRAAHRIVLAAPGRWRIDDAMEASTIAEALDVLSMRRETC
ncbi:ABC transporter ATP-binding protein [Marilutibacter chinensis]|uniref:ATP-binding cassette domain-containing protein n=1 Tax=Marilutibacter chinensis TaxID=2912247 RepID=A0ABS9HQA9_9GAMM|nr:ATP-binding cassette domain-containing protein [Lysobacter chinensis]MCF7221121.1 ATP-binding cassette domain-containing protein [Lysobacter chinensis]